MSVSGPFRLRDLLRSKTGFTVTPEAPAGVLYPYAGASAPSGYLLCDGSAVSRTTYSELFAALGTAYGAGDGSTTFNLPDMRGRTPIGAGQGSGLTNRTRGQSLGSETHTLTAAQSGIPGHTHNLTIAAQQGNYPTEFNFPHTGRIVFSRAGGANEGGGYVFPNSYLGGTAEARDAVNASQSHPNVQPSLVVNYIIKT